MYKMKKLLALLVLTAASAGCEQVWGMEQKDVQKLSFSEKLNDLEKDISEEKIRSTKLLEILKGLKKQYGIAEATEQVDLENERYDENSDEYESSDENNDNERIDEELKVFDPEIKIEKNEQPKPCEAFILKIGEPDAEDNGIAIYALNVNDSETLTQELDVTPTCLERFYLVQPNNKKLEKSAWKLVATAWKMHDEKNENIIGYVIECIQDQTIFNCDNLEIILSEHNSCQKNKNVQLESISAVIQNNSILPAVKNNPPALKQNTKKGPKQNLKKYRSYVGKGHWKKKKKKK